jgi:hypothetical protein
VWGGIAFPTIEMLSHIHGVVITNYACENRFHDLSQLNIIRHHKILTFIFSFIYNDYV